MTTVNYVSVVYCLFIAMQLEVGLRGTLLTGSKKRRTSRIFRKVAQKFSTSLFRDVIGKSSCASKLRVMKFFVNSHTTTLLPHPELHDKEIYVKETKFVESKI